MAVLAVVAAYVLKARMPRRILEIATILRHAGAKMKPGKVLVVLFLVGLIADPVRSGWGDMGDCTYRVTGDLYYYESFRMLGDNGGGFVAVGTVGWDDRYVWGTGSLGEHWLFPRAAQHEDVERFSSEERWLVRLEEVGVRVPPVTAPVSEYRPWPCDLVEVRDALAVLVLGYAWRLLDRPENLLALAAAVAFLVVSFAGSVPGGQPIRRADVLCRGNRVRRPESSGGRR